MMGSGDESSVENGPAASQAAQHVEEQLRAPTEPTGPVDAPNPHRLRRGMVWLLAALAGACIVAFTIVLWVQQVALNTNRFETIVAPLATDPAVVANLSNAISQQVVDTLNLQARLNEVLPGRLDLLAAPLTGAAQDLVREQLSKVMSSPAFPELWASATRRIHSLLVRTVRDDPRNPSVSFSGGEVTIDLVALAGSALQTRQPISASPSLLNRDIAPQDTRRSLSAALDIQVPDDFGQVVLLQSDGLAAAQRAARLLDRSVWAVFVLVILLIAAALGLSLDRRRTVIAIGMSAVLVTLLVALLLPVLLGNAASTASAGAGQSIIMAVLASAQDNLRTFLGVTLSLSVLAAIVAHIAGRPRWLLSANAALARAPNG